MEPFVCDSIQRRGDDWYVKVLLHSCIVCLIDVRLKVEQGKREEAMTEKELRVLGGQEITLSTPESYRDRRGRLKRLTCRLRGLPFFCSDEEIKEFLNPLPFRTVVQGKSGIAYVKCDTEQQALDLTKHKHKQYMGSRYVEVVLADEEAEICCTWRKT